jgi:hypothetical protein
MSSIQPKKLDYSSDMNPFMNLRTRLLEKICRYTLDVRSVRCNLYALRDLLRDFSFLCSVNAHRLPLYQQTARQRQRWDDQQILPHVNWGDLFFDLFYVGAAYNLAVILKESPSWEGFLYFVCCFAPIQGQWNEKLMYDARFAPEDNLFHRTMEGIHLLVLGTAIQHIRPVEMMKDIATYPTMFVFSLSLVIMNFMEYKRAKDVEHNVVGGDEARHTAANNATRKMCGIVPLTLAAIISGYGYFSAEVEEEEERWENIPILLCLGGYICEQSFTLFDAFYWLPRSGRNFKEVRVPMNIDFTLHRLAEWVMLMLGESVLALLLVE